jgi:hypothetical protein
MSHKLNLVRVLTAATGNSTPIVLGAAYSQLFMLPSEAGAMDGRTYSYLIVDGNNWEMGRGVYTASGTTLSRNVIASRVSGTLGTSRISLTGTAQVRFVDAAEDMDGVRGTRPVTGTTDTLNNSDLGFVVTYSNASAIAVSLAQAGTSGLFLDGWATTVKNKNVGTVTVTPATSTIGGTPTLKVLQGQTAFIWSDGTNYDCVVYSDTAKIDVHGADIASASTVNLETATGDVVDVTGTTTVTAITLSEGHERTVRFAGALTLTNGASLVLPGSANIATVAGDFAVFRGYASGVVRCVDYVRASGKPLVKNTPSELGAEPETIAKSLASSGFCKLGNGLILQWGSANNGGDPTTVTFPTAFPAACTSVVVTIEGAPGANVISGNVASRSASGFQFYQRYTPGGSVATAGNNFVWQAIGY